MDLFCSLLCSRSTDVFDLEIITCSVFTLQQRENMKRCKMDNSFFILDTLSFFFKKIFCMNF